MFCFLQLLTRRIVSTVLSELKPMTLVGIILGLVKFHDLHWLPISRGFRWFQCPESFHWGEFRTLSYFRCNDRSGATDGFGDWEDPVQRWDLICNLLDVDGAEVVQSEDWIPWVSYPVWSEILGNKNPFVAAHSQENILGGGFDFKKKYTYLGRWSKLANMFQRGLGNHQPDIAIPFPVRTGVRSLYPSASEFKGSWYSPPWKLHKLLIWSKTVWNPSV